jgi:hypothetical protein
VTPEQRVTAAIDCTPYAKATPDAYATAALDAVRDALTSDDPQVVGAMAERVGLSVSTQEGFEAARRDSIDKHGHAHVFSYRADDPRKIRAAITNRWLGLSPEKHVLVRSTTVTAAVWVHSPWREVPDAD